MKVTVTIEAESLHDFTKLGKAFGALGDSVFGVNSALDGLMYRNAMRDIIDHGAKMHSDTMSKFTSGGMVKTDESGKMATVGDKPGPEVVHMRDIIAEGSPEPPRHPELLKNDIATKEASKKTRQTKAEKQLSQATDMVENGEVQLNPDGSMAIMSGVDVEPAVQKIAYDLLKQRHADLNDDVMVNTPNRTPEVTEQPENAPSVDTVTIVADDPNYPTNIKAVVSDPNTPVVTEDLLRRICYTLNTYGPAGKASLSVILKEVGATKFSEIPKEKYDYFYKLAMSDINLFNLTVPEEL